MSQKLGRLAFGGREVSDAVDGEAAVVGDEIYAQGSFAGPLDEDVDVGWEGLLVVVVVLGKQCQPDRSLVIANTRLR